jgi:hypothetical protein
MSQKRAKIERKFTAKAAQPPPGFIPVPGMPNANLEKVAKLADHLVAAFEEYVSDEETAFYDAAMAVHNFHRVIILDLADRFEMEDDDLETYFAIWEQTWRQAMLRAPGEVLRHRHGKGA